MPYLRVPFHDDNLNLNLIKTLTPADEITLKASDEVYMNI